MTIRVQCPNASCGHMLTVRDEYAGKRGKCPACGGAMMIPSPIGRGILASQPAVPPPSKARSGEIAAPTAATDDVPLGTSDDLRLPATDPGTPTETMAELPYPLPEPPLPPPEIPPPLAPASAPTVPPSFPAGYSMAELAVRTALVVGIAALLLLSFTPQIRWIHVSSPGAGLEAQLRMQAVQMGLALGLTGGGVGMALLVYSVILALLAVGCLVLREMVAPEKSDPIIAAVGGLAGGWGVTVFFWMLGFIWKAFTTAGRSGNEGLTIFPGFGPILGVFAALSVIAVFGYLVYSRQRFIWLGAGGGLGFFFGMLLLIFNARPWEPWFLGGF